MLIADYLRTGTATRKFDGISVKVENNKVKCSFACGLGAVNSIKSIPLHEQIENINGDDPLEPSFEEQD